MHSACGGWWWGGGGSLNCPAGSRVPWAVCMWQRGGIDTQVFLHWLWLLHIFIMPQCIKTIFTSQLDYKTFNSLKFLFFSCYFPVYSCEFTNTDHVQCISVRDFSQMNTQSVNRFHQTEHFMCWRASVNGAKMISASKLEEINVSKHFIMTCQRGLFPTEADWFAEEKVWLCFGLKPLSHFGPERKAQETNGQLV